MWLNVLFYLECVMWINEWWWFYDQYLKRPLYCTLEILQIICFWKATNLTLGPMGAVIIFYGCDFNQIGT